MLAQNTRSLLLAVGNVAFGNIALGILAVGLVALTALPMAHAGRADVDLKKTPSEPPAPMEHKPFTSNGITRNYAMFFPPKTALTGLRPLLVMLHGCTQDAERFAASTRTNELAIRENIIILYPEQSAEANPMRCWNWFEASNQTRASGPSERAWLAALIDSVATSSEIDRKRIYIAGISAGAAMSVNMLSCHPDLFAGGGIFAGVPFAAATDTATGMQVMKSGSLLSANDSAQKAFICGESKTGPSPRIFILHGKADKLVAAINSTQILNHFQSLADLRDDSISNGSARFTRAMQKKVKSRRGSYPYKIEEYKNSAGDRMQLVQVEKLGHAWSGGQAGQEYSDPKGPPADIMWDFLTNSLTSKP